MSSFTMKNPNNPDLRLALVFTPGGLEISIEARALPGGSWQELAGTLIDDISAYQLVEAIKRRQPKKRKTYERRKKA